MKNVSQAALTAAKNRLPELTTAVAECEIRAAAEAADLEVCRALVSTLQKRRVAAIGACKVADVVEIDGALLRARIAEEIAEARAARSGKDLGDAGTALHDIRRAIETAARAVLAGELVELAAEFDIAMDRALELGRKLQALCTFDRLNIPLNQELPTIPAQCARALERLPQPNRLHTPLYLLRAGGELSDAYAVRLRELIDEKPDEDSIDDAA